MTFRPRNAYYLRISSSIVLPLFLYLDERHIDWMSDVSLQHILADLRPLIIPKLQAERDVHFNQGAASSNKRGTVEVHRGETYQFAYFFRKTEPHSVVLKSRNFVTAPPVNMTGPKPACPQPAGRAPQKRRSQNKVSGKQRKRKHANNKGMEKQYFDEDDSSEKSEDMGFSNHVPRRSRPVRKQRRIAIDLYQEDDDDDADYPPDRDDVTITFPSPETEGLGDSYRDNEAQANEYPDISSDTADIELAVEEEEEKPKPLLKLKYQSFPISGHCLCVVVEPWPPLRAEATPAPIGLRMSSLPLSREPVSVGQRAKTPLFFPEDDKIQSEVPFMRERALPPVPLFQEATNDGNDDLMIFSQSLNAADHMHAVTADDDDDMDGVILFGDADEARELF